MANAARMLRTGTAAALLLAACTTTTPSQDSLQNTVRNQDDAMDSLTARVDELDKQRSELELRVKVLQAEVDKARTAESAVESAKEEFRAHVREVMKEFKGDRDIQVEQTPGGYRFVVGETVLFDPGSAQLKNEGRTALARVGTTLRDGDSLVSIEGHTDNVPVAKPETLKQFPRGNIELSTARALAVWEFLAKDGGVAESRLSVAGYGPHRPRAANDTDLNRWKNRRVEILVAER